MAAVDFLGKTLFEHAMFGALEHKINGINISDKDEMETDPNLEEMEIDPERMDIEVKIVGVTATLGKEGRSFTPITLPGINIPSNKVTDYEKNAEYTIEERKEDDESSLKKSVACIGDALNISGNFCNYTTGYHHFQNPQQIESFLKSILRMVQDFPSKTDFFLIFKRIPDEKLWKSLVKSFKLILCNKNVKQQFYLIESLGFGKERDDLLTLLVNFALKDHYDSVHTISNDQFRSLARNWEENEDSKFHFVDYDLNEDEILEGETLCIKSNEYKIEEVSQFNRLPFTTCTDESGEAKIILV